MTEEEEEEEAVNASTADDPADGIQEQHSESCCSVEEMVAHQFSNYWEGFGNPLKPKCNVSESRNNSKSAILECG